MYSEVERASVPPERLLKAPLLISLYPTLGERALCEELEYNLLFLRFMSRSLMERSFDADGVHQEPPAWCASAPAYEGL